MLLLKNIVLALMNIPSVVVILWQFGLKAPNAFIIIRRINAVFGSEEFQKLLEAIGVAAKTETEKLPQPPDTEPARLRLFDRIRQRFALNQLRMTELQYIAFCDANGTAGPIQDEQLA